MDTAQSQDARRSTNRRPSVMAASLLALVLCAGCDLPTGPGFGDPALFAFDESFRYSCDRWRPHEPEVALGLFDVLWSSEPRASRAQRDRVLAQGGSIVYEYHLGMLRVIMPPAGAAALDANQVRAVLDPADRTVEVYITFFERKPSALSSMPWTERFSEAPAPSPCGPRSLIRTCLGSGNIPPCAA